MKLFCFCLFFPFLMQAQNEFSFLLGEDRWNPEEYVHYVKNYESWALQRLNSHRFLGDEKVLDFGCMDGRITRFIATKVPLGYVVGVDSSQSMIDYASETYKEIENLKFQQNNELELDCEYQFNLITSFFVIQWVKDISLKINQFKRCLALGGMLWMVTTYKIPEKIAFATLKLLDQEKWKGYFKDYVFPVLFYNSKDYIRFFAAANLELLDSQIFSGRELFASREAFHSYLEQELPLLDVIPNELKQDFLDEFIDYYLEVSPLDIYGRVTMERDIIEVKARKVSH